MNTDASWHRATPKRNNQRSTDERYTQDSLLKVVQSVLGTIDLDPAADPERRVPAKNHFTKEDDGLSKSWSGKVFLNPPFSKTPTWIKHLCLYCTSGAISEAILLVPVMALSNKTSRLLMQQLASAFVLMERNLQFLDEQYEPITTGAPFPFALVYIGSRTDDFFTATQDLGVCCLIKNPQPKNRKNSFCNYCGKTFVAKRSTAKFCGSTCRSLAHKKSKIN